MITHLHAALAALLFLLVPLPGGAMQVPQDPPVVAVTKQEMAQAKFKELTERMQKLMAMLQGTEPEQSALLGLGLRFSQEKKLQSRLDVAGTMLREERWDEALVTMNGVRGDLNKLLELLQNRNADLRKLLEEIERLEQFRDRVDQLAQEQGEEKEDSARTEALQKHLADIEAKKQAVMALLAEQQQVREATNALGVKAAANATEPLADKEGQLEDRTEKLAGELDALEQNDAELKADVEAAEARAGKAQAGKPEAGKPEAGKPEAGKPESGKPEAGKPEAGKPSAGRPSPAKSSACSGNASKAAKSMGQAQAQLGGGKPEPSLKDQDQAIEALKQTMAELDKMAEDAKRELQRLPFEQQAKKQEKTQHATDTLSKDMEKAETAEDGSEQKPTPGKKRVQQAVPKQRAAAGQLKEYVPAKQKQQDAKEDLEEAKKELEEALAQLRQQLQDEVLRALEERFTAMLARQRELTVQTRTLHGTRTNLLTADGSLPAALLQKIAEIAGGEGELRTEAADALKLLEEDATTAVFPELVVMLRDELGVVRGRLDERETGEGVQQAQRDIEQLLTDLINALRKTIELKEGGHCTSCGGGGQPPLVPVSAELKLLRYMQERVNKATKEFDARPEEQKLAEAGKASSQQLSGKQDRVHDLMRRLAEKLAKESETEEGR